MDDEKWYTLAKASEKIGKNAMYFVNLKNTKPDYFEGIALMRQGNYWLIKESDIPIVLKRVKKRGDHLKNRLFKWSKTANSHFAV